MVCAFMKLPHGWVLIRGFNLCCEVHRCHLMGREIPGQRGQPLCWPYCMFQVVNPWCALQGWTAPAVQSHLLKLLSLLYMKIHEIKLKISVPFTLTYIYFCFVFNVCLFFFLLEIWACCIQNILQWTLQSGCISAFPGGTSWLCASWP